MRKILATTLMLLGLVGLPQAHALAQTVPTNGEITKIDDATKRITIRHEPIKNLDMGAMNMVFRVKDPDMLKIAKVGDKITFEADRIDGALTVVSLKKKE